ncbi:tetratricopeptide repeat protein, partial [Arthrobacter antibioticus]|uniref:tetratricopeptide repeat protein n=1 Tax=Arthrobacter sp. H35-MC1 TaxID=3046203 RepID=UPI0024BBD181
RGGQGGRPAPDRDSRPSYGNREDRPARPAFGGRDDRPARSNDRPYGDRDNRGGQGGRPAPDRDSRPSYGNREDRPARPAFGGRDDRPARSNDRPSHGSARDDRGPRTTGPRTPPERNAGDLRSSNRPDRERSPEIDPDVTGEELDKVTRAQLRILDAKNNEWVSKHLVMAGRLIDFVPEVAFEHALAASRRGGRLACVREAVAMTAYAAGKYGEALRELRTFRRISGSNAHLPLMADCERGLGRPDRALDLIKSEDAEGLDLAGKVELAIVESGARGDLGEMEAALSALEIPQLDINRAFSFSPRLFRAYGMILRAAGRKDEAKTWERQALVAEEALGIDEGTDQIIIDLGDDEEIPLESPRVRVSDVMAAPVAPVMNDADIQAAAELPSGDAEVAQHDELNVDDAQSSYFDSDDAESDADSADTDSADTDSADTDSHDAESLEQVHEETVVEDAAEGEDVQEPSHSDS